MNLTLIEFHELDRSGKMVVTLINNTFHKLKSKITCYRKYKHFPNDPFRDTLLEVLSKVRVSNNDDLLNNFLKAC